MPGEPQGSPIADRSGGSRRVTLLIVSVGLAVLVVFAFLKISAAPPLRLTTCFQDVSGLRSGARVRVAGVDVGTVRDVRAQPTNRACPGLVVMELRTPYDLKLPNDSVAFIATEGILGQAFTEIDVSAASGPPVQNGDRLPSKESEKVGAAYLDRALKTINELTKRLSEAEKDCNAQSAKTHSDTKPTSKPSASSIPK